MYFYIFIYACECVLLCVYLPVQRKTLDGPTLTIISGYLEERDLGNKRENQEILHH